MLVFKTNKNSGTAMDDVTLFFRIVIPVSRTPKAFPRILRRRCAVGVGLKVDARHWEVVSCESYKDIPLVMSMIMIS